MKLAILGASGHGKVAADIAGLSGYKKIVFFDDAWPSKKKIAHWPILGDTKCLISTLFEYDACFVAIGNNKIRADKQTQLQSYGIGITSLVHPKSVVSEYATIGHGSIIMPNAVVGSFARIGEGTIVNTAATIDHDVNLGIFVHISPGSNIAGEVIIGGYTWVGIGACVKQGLTLGDHVIVGAGSVVLRDVDSGSTVVGCPAQ